MKINHSPQLNQLSFILLILFQVHVLEREKGAVSANGAFDSAADETVAQGHDQTEHDYADEAANAAFPDHEQTKNHHRRMEVVVSTREGHEPIENRIDQRVVDEPKQLSIDTLKPIH